MKKIIIATDFSPSSHNAALYGVQLAKSFGAKIYLMNAYQVPVPVPESYLIYTQEDVWISIEASLLREAELINPEGEVEIEICGNAGSAARAILQMAEQIHPDIIVCGMKKGNKGIRSIFGSVTIELSKVSTFPVLIVPEGIYFSKFQHIALAADMDYETKAETIDLLQTIVEAFHSRLTVVCVVEKEIEEQFQKRFLPCGLTRKLHHVNAVFKFPVGKDIPAVLAKFIELNNTDILALIPHRHSWLESFFVLSTTKKMIFESNIPLLILPQQTGLTFAGETGGKLSETNS